MAELQRDPLITTWIAPGAVARLGEALEAVGSKDIVLVTGAGSYERSGARAAIEPQLAGYAVEVVDGFFPNPSVEEVEAGLDAVRRAGLRAGAGQGARSGPSRPGLSARS